MRRPRPHTNLLDLSDELLHLIFTHLQTPVRVTTRHRLSPLSLTRSLPLAQTCTRLHAVFATTLSDLEPWPAGQLTPTGLSFLTRTAGPTLRRLILRNCNRLTAASLTALATHCRSLRTLDLSLLSAVDDALLARLAEALGPTLESLLLRRCARVGDAGIIAVADHCPHLHALDAAGLVLLTDRAVAHLASARAASLRILILSWCTRLTDASLVALAATRLRALFLRGLLVTDLGVAALAEGLGGTLATVDLLDCPNLTNFAFATVLRRDCRAMRDKLRLAESRDMFQNSVSLLDGYVHVVAGVNQFAQQSTLICIVDAGSANAFAFQVLSGQPISFESDDVKVLATNSGLAVTDETKDFVKESFGIEL